MSLFNFTSIKDKLIAITMISCAISLIIAGSIMIVYSWDTHKENTVNRLNVIASVLGNRSSAALVFDDASLVQENMQSLKFEPGILLACIYAIDKHSNPSASTMKRLVGEYLQKADQRKTCNTTMLRFSAGSDRFHYDELNNIFIHQPILFEDEPLGEISIYSDYSIINRKVMFDATIISVVIVLGISVAFFLIRRLQRVISAPILELSDTATRISSDTNTSIRAKHYSNDETGKLVNAFNNMLDTIENQNRTLTHVKNNYLALYDKNPMMLFTLDENGIIISANEYGAMHLGISVEDILNRKFYDFVFEDDIDRTMALVDECKKDLEEVRRSEIRITDADGRMIWTRSTARCIVNEEQNNNLLFVCEDITEQKKLSEKLSFQASHDALTGLVNRREFEHRINNAISSVKQEQTEHALFFLDLDQFKVINDTCGHLAGDHLLKELASVINPLIRQGDTLARIGGDEFGVLLENCALNQASNVAEQIRQKINDFKFIWDNKELGVGVSIGVVPIDENTSSITVVMSDADAACYIAKEAGRNKIHIYQHGDEEIASRHGEMTWVTRLQDALSNDRFTLMAQEIASNKEPGTESLHIELLLRMLDDDGSIISPDQFLPAAERYNLSPDIDRWVIRTAFSWLNNHPQTLQRLGLCSINLSGNTLSDERFSEFLLQQFKTHDIPSHKICFEITETSAISNLEVALRFFHSFSNDLNCKFSLDDFGTGHSSFAYLKNMPVDFIKIDGQFVRDITNDPIDMAMVRSINEIAQIMGKKTIAEFVENEQTLKQLKLIGIDFVQGYHIARPVALDEFSTNDSPGHQKSN